MIARILRSANTSSAVEYNEKKAAEGNAFVVGYNLFRNANMFEIYDTFEDYETNPAIATKTKNKGFHMTLSPDRGDAMYEDDEMAVSLLADIMERMGFADQPYVIYRHNDIDRTHYHLVSTRVRRDGRVIPSGYEGRRMNSILNDLKEKYGYAVGRDEASSMSVDMAAGRLSPEAEGKVRAVMDAFDEALGYNFTSFAQFQTVMSQMGVRVKSRELSRRRTMWFAVEDEDGKVASMGFNAERDLKVDAYSRFEKRLLENEEKRPEPMTLAKMQEALVYCAEKAGSWPQFRRMMSECGIAFIGQEKGGRLVSFSLVDRERRCVLPSLRLGRAYDVEMLNSRGWDLLGEDDAPRSMLTAGDFDEIRRRIIDNLVRAGYTVRDNAVRDTDEERKIGHRLDVTAMRPKRSGSGKR